VNYGASSAFNQNQVVLSDFQLNLTADFDEDGDVDGDDLTRWRNNFGTGTTPMQGDADGDNDSDGNDFLAWQQQLGSVPAVPAAAPSAGAVPEPAASVLAAIVATLATAPRRRRR
jgi:hypothetical protein